MEEKQKLGCSLWGEFSYGELGVYWAVGAGGLFLWLSCFAYIQ